MGLRAGWRVLVVVPAGGAPDVEVVRPWWEPLRSWLSSLQLWSRPPPAPGAGSSSARYWLLWSPVSCSPRRWTSTSCTIRPKCFNKRPLCVFQSSNVQPSAYKGRQISSLAAATFTHTYTCNTFEPQLASNTITMSLSLKTLPVSWPDLARPINAGSCLST